MSEQYFQEDQNGLIRNLISYTRSACIVTIALIFARRLYLGGFLGTFDSASMVMRVIAILDELVELTALLGTPVCLWLWLGLAKWQYLRYPRMYDYALILLLYVIAYGYLPPPHGHDILHFGGY